MPLTAETERGLLSPVAPWSWPGANPFGPLAVLPLPDGLTPIRPTPSAHPARRELIERSCDIMIAAEADLNALDTRIGDGDTGSTLATAARALIGRLDRLPLADLTQLFRAVGTELSQTMGGSSGVLLAIFFSASADASANGNDWIESLAAGLDRVRQVGGAMSGDRTMIDALAPALAALRGGVDAAARAARAGTDLTAGMTSAKAGRASYLPPERLEGYNDPGAEAVARLFEQLADRRNGRNAG